MSILGDEWRYAYWTSTDGALEKGFNPAPGRYAIPIPMLLYQGLFEAFGADSYLPFRVVMCFFLALVTGLAYEFMRRRLGYGLALPLAALIPLFGFAGEVVVNSFRMPGMISLAATLGALLAIETRTPRRDVLAAVLLVIGVASHPLALAFVAAVAIIRLPLFLAGRARLATIGLLAAPAIVFLAVLRPDDPRAEPLTTKLAEVPEFLFAGLKGLMNALTGFASSSVPIEGLAGFRSPVGIVVVILLAGLVCRVVWKRRLDSVAVVGLLAAAVIILMAPVFAPSDRAPNLGRYVFPAGICVLLALAELGRGLPAWLAQRNAATGAATAGLALLGGLALASNTVELEREAREYADDSRHVRAQAAALEEVRGQGGVDRSIRIEQSDRNIALIGEKYRFTPAAGEYYVIADDYGTSAWTPEELARQSPEVQRTARISKQIVLGKLP